MSKLRLLPVLNESTAMQSWAETCRVHRSLTAVIGAFAVYLPIYALVEKLALPWPIRDLNWLSGRHSVKESAAENATSLALVDHRLLSQVLGCQPTEILPLIESSALRGLSGHRSIRDTRFDLVTLAKQVERLETVVSGQVIDMVHAARIASAHGGHMGHVLAGILLKEIPFRPNSDRKALLDGAFVGVDSLLAWMAKHLASLEAAHCTLLETIAITGMNKQEITTACSLGLIKPLGWKRELCFQGGEISRLLSSHISIKRWSKMSGVPARRPLASLTESCFEAAIAGVLYKRTEELDSWLNSFASR